MSIVHLLNPSPAGVPEHQNTLREGDGFNPYRFKAILKSHREGGGLI